MHVGGNFCTANCGQAAANNDMVSLLLTNNRNLPTPYLTVSSPASTAYSLATVQNVTDNRRTTHRIIIATVCTVG